jgi:hypothetical protein
MEKQLKRRRLVGAAAACSVLLLASAASAVVIDFAGGTATLKDGSTVATSNTTRYSGVASYVENGVKIQFNYKNGVVSNFGSTIGDYYTSSNAVIHAHWDNVWSTGLMSITFSMVDGSPLDLNYMDITSNTINAVGAAAGTEDSWVTASNGAAVKLPPTDWGSVQAPHKLWLSDKFDDITSFTVTSTNASCFGLDNFYINEPPPPEFKPVNMTPVYLLLRKKDAYFWDFELPSVPAGDWLFFPPDEVPEWTVKHTFPNGKASPPQLEFWNHLMQAPYSGNQNIELDSDNSTTISLSVPTQPGGRYVLKYAWAPRPSVAENHMKVWVNGSETAVHQASGVGQTTIHWTVSQYEFTAAGTSTSIAFGEVGQDNALGMLLDAVSLVQQ